MKVSEGNLCRLRAIALASNDWLVRSELLDFINESEEAARLALSETCWADDMAQDLSLERLGLRIALCPGKCPVCGETLQTQGRDCSCSSCGSAWRTGSDG